MTRPQGEMSDELFHKIIKEGKEMGANQFLPFLNGEPFMFPRIWEWLDYMKDVRVYLFTNAELMDVDRIIKYKNIRYICCGINAATKETHKKIMRGPDYDTVVSKVKELIKKAPFKVFVSMVVVNDNKHEAKLFKTIWGKHAVFGDFKNWGGARHDKMEKKSANRVPCVSLMHSLSILWDGRVVPCCLDFDGKQIIGDANKQSLKQIWEQSAWMRDQHRKFNFNMVPCKECNQNI